MTINYTTLLGLAQPVTGTEAGTWGDTVNDAITALVEQAVAGGTSIDVTGGNVTLTSTAGTSNQARNAILIITGTPGVSRNVIAPSSSKVYIVINGSNGAVVIKGSATTGVTVASGSRAIVAWNGSDFVEVGQAGDVDGPTSSTDNAVARFDGTSGKIIKNSAVTIADTTGNITGGTYNGLTVSTTTGTFTLTNGKTFAVQNTVTLAGTDSTTMTLPTTSQTLAGLGVSSQVFTTAQTFRAASAVRSEAASTQDAIVLAGRAGGTSSYAVTLTPATLSSSTTLTLPNVTDTVATIGTAQTFTAAQTFRAANAIRSEAASTQDAIVIAGRAGGTSSYALTLTPATLAASRTVTLPDPGANYTVGFRNIPQSGSDKTTSYTLTVDDIGEFVGVGSGGSITIPNSTFAAGDAISIFNNTSAGITITCSITTAYISGTDSDKATVTLATRGVCTVLFISSTVCVISGSVS